MHKAKVILFSFIALLCILNLNAKPISAADALRKAQEFYAKNISSESGKNLVKSNSNFQLVYTASDTERPEKVLGNVAEETEQVAESLNNTYFYVFNDKNQKRFVIVSADDATKSILAYSDESEFAPENIPDNLKYWLDIYKSEIKYAKISGLKAPLINTIENEANPTVAPLLGGLKWNQGSPYNLLCPPATGEKALTGCVATAMAQIMWYHKWPTTGAGSHTYTHATYGALSADFGATSYDWANMTETYNSSSTTAQNNAVATLMYHCGVAVDMNFGLSAAGGSSAVTRNTGIALVNYFGYDPDIQFYDRDNFTYTDWKQIIKTELNAARPIIYSGRTDDGGHAFICDGYDSNNLFHINWGWGGQSNGYFELSSLNSAAPDIRFSPGGYSQSQSIIMGVQKNDGISNPFYSLNFFQNGLSATTSTISYIPSQTFNASFGYLNNNYSTFSGKVGLGLYLNGIFQKVLSQKTISSLAPNYGNTSSLFSSISLNGLTSSTYQIFPVFQVTGQSDWTKFSQTIGLNRSLEVNINGSSATIFQTLAQPTLELTSALSASSNLYQNKTTNFKFSVKNTGGEFYSYLGVYLYNADKSVTQYIKTGVLCIPSNETISFEIPGSITVAPGNYSIAVVADSTNSYATKYKIIGKSPFNPINVSVQATPAAPVLTLGAVAMEKTTMVRYDTNTLTATITNTGGYYDYKTYAYILPSTGGTPLGNFNPQILYIDNNSTKTVTFTGNVDLTPGNYYMKIYYYNGTKYQYDTNPAYFTIIAPTLSFSAATLNIAKTVVSNNTISVNSNTSWAAVSNQSWLTVSPLSGSGNKSLTLSASANSGNIREAIVTISTNGVESQTLKVVQAGLNSAISTANGNINISIYPNPTTDVLHVETLEMVKLLQVQDLTGRILANSVNTKYISTIDLKSGVYLLYIETEHAKTTQRFVKK